MNHLIIKMLQERSPADLIQVSIKGAPYDYFTVADLVKMLEQAIYKSVDITAKPTWKVRIN